MMVESNSSFSVTAESIVALMNSFGLPTIASLETLILKLPMPKSVTLVTLRTTPEGSAFAAAAAATLSMWLEADVSPAPAAASSASPAASSAASLGSASAGRVNRCSIAEATVKASSNRLSFICLT